MLYLSWDWLCCDFPCNEEITGLACPSGLKSSWMHPCSFTGRWPETPYTVACTIVLPSTGCLNCGWDFVGGILAWCCTHRPFTACLNFCCICSTCYQWLWPVASTTIGHYVSVCNCNLADLAGLASWTHEGDWVEKMTLLSSVGSHYYFYWCQEWWNSTYKGEPSTCACCQKTEGLWLCLDPTSW